jgi:uncharacterized membrane protein YphA (DoxX/SURF4 family)
MTRALLVIVCQVVLAGTFFVAGIGKWRDRQGTRQAVEDFALPSVLHRPVALGLPLAECAIAVVLLPPATRVVGGALALALLLVFTVAIAAAFRRGVRPRCHCFGARSSEPVGPEAIARNLALSVLAFVVVLRG